MLLVLLRVVLALTFATAAVAKLSDLGSFRRATVDLGIPKRVVPMVAFGVPVAELAVALGLFAGLSAFAASLIGIGLTVAFTVLLIVNLSRGNRPACNCFGAANHEPIGPWSLARNTALICGFAVVAVKDPRRGVGQSFSSFALSHASPATCAVVLGAVGVALVFLVLQLVLRRRTVAPAPREITSHGLAVGAAAPSFVLPDLTGREVALDDLRKPALPVLLVFIDPDCAPCAALLPELADWRKSFSESVFVAVVSRGTVEENQAKLASLEIAPVLLQEARELALAYKAVATPSAVLISRAGRIHGTAAGAHAIRHLVDAVVDTPAGESTLTALPPGAEAPLFEVPSASADDSITLLSRRGRMTVLVFWSTTCTFCLQMAARLQAWERSLDLETGPHLVVLSDGTPSRRDAPFAHVGIDEGTLLRRAYGVDRTPMALLIDAEGRVAAPSAVGADQVMALAQRAVTLSAVAQRLSTRFRPIEVSADPPAEVRDERVPDHT